MYDQIWTFVLITLSIGFEVFTSASMQRVDSGKLYSIYSIRILHHFLEVSKCANECFALSDCDIVWIENSTENCFFESIQIISHKEWMRFQLSTQKLNKTINITNDHQQQKNMLPAKWEIRQCEHCLTNPAM